MDVDLPLTELHRVEELWFDDGNIVLQAGYAQYKVFRGILARHSVVFQDMFAFPQPPDAELLDGCPLVHLPDAEVEVTPFLKALFEPNYFPPFPMKTTLVTLYGCLPLSSKYAVDAIRTNALKHLTSMFHTSFDEWDDETSLEDDNEYPQYLVCCLQLGYDVDATWTLPCLYFTLATFFDVLKLSQFKGVRWRGIKGKIPDAHQNAAMAGAEEQMRECWNIVLDVLANPTSLSLECDTPNACSAAILAQLHELQRDNRDFCRDPLNMWQPGDLNWTAHTASVPLCPDCQSHLETKVEAQQRAFWDRLPEIYGLPSWAELEVMKKAAIGDADDEE